MATDPAVPAAARQSGWSESFGSARLNAAMESFFGLLQNNVLDRRRWDTRERLRIVIVTWIERTYHRRRRQAGPSGRVTETVTYSCSRPKYPVWPASGHRTLTPVIRAVLVAAASAAAAVAAPPVASADPVVDLMGRLPPGDSKVRAIRSTDRWRTRGHSHGGMFG